MVWVFGVLHGTSLFLVSIDQSELAASPCVAMCASQLVSAAAGGETRWRKPR